MEARKMFKELGYEKKEESEGALLYISDFENNILFDKKRVTISDLYCSGRITINHLLENAIHKQCEELGWLEEEKQETNFEHYKDEIRDADFDFAVRDGKVIPCDGCPCSECLFFGNHTSCSVLRIEWLYQKYQRKYKLTQFEYDLIKAFDRCKECCLLNEIECLKKLSEKGYFKGIDPFTKVHDIIDNCEVVG